MNVVRLAILALVPAFSWAFICEDTYHLQSVSQTIYSGDNPKNLTNVQKKLVKADLSDLDILDSNIAYRVIVKFEGACLKASKPVTIKSRLARKKDFTDSVTSEYQIQMFDSNTRVEGFKYDFWFGFFKPDTTLRMVLGRTNANSTQFENWYLAIVYTDSTRDSSGTWPRGRTHFYELIGPEDSLVLEKRVLDETLRKVVVDENHKGRFSYQFLKVSFDSKVPTKLHPRNSPATKFHVDQTGTLVLIQPGEKQAINGEAVSLFGMMGNKIATLHPTGYVYQWNGKTSIGADAPTGVYFVQSGGRILGKFFYVR
jgi:hypothetical protein